MDTTAIVQRPQIEKTATSAAGIGIAICLLFSQNLLISAKDVSAGIPSAVNYVKEQRKYEELVFEQEILEDVDNYQGVAVMNFTSKKEAYTRIIEHKHFEFNDCKGTVITKEYPSTWKIGDEAYYPVNDEKNMNLYNQYKELAEKEENVIFGGRLGQYKYYDMDKIIEEALNLVEEVRGENH